MFKFSQNSKSNSDSIITLDTVNQKIHHKRRQTIILAFLAIFFLGNKYLIDCGIELLANNRILDSQLGFGLYLFASISTLYFILSLVQQTSNLMSQRDEIKKLLVDC